MTRHRPPSVGLNNCPLCRTGAHTVPVVSATRTLAQVNDYLMHVLCQSVGTGMHEGHWRTSGIYGCAGIRLDRGRLRSADTVCEWSAAMSDTARGATGWFCAS